MTLNKLHAALSLGTWNHQRDAEVLREWAAFLSDSEQRTVPGGTVTRVVIFLSGLAAAIEANGCQDNTKLGEVVETIRSDEFRCPGGHRDDGKPPDRSIKSCYDYAQGLWHDHSTAIGWVPMGACKRTIRITLEEEHGDYGTVLSAYPVADQDDPCVISLGFDDDGDYLHPIWGEWTERMRLRAMLGIPAGWAARNLEGG